MIKLLAHMSGHDVKHAVNTDTDKVSFFARFEVNVRCSKCNGTSENKFEYS